MRAALLSAVSALALTGAAQAGTPATYQPTLGNCNGVVVSTPGQPIVCLPSAAAALAYTVNSVNGIRVNGMLGLSGSAQTTTGTVSAGSRTLTLGAAQDFANGQGIRINHAGAAFTLGQATGASVTPNGVTGSTTWQYKLATLDSAGGVGAATALFQTTSGNATLSATNFNALSWTPPGGSPAGYAVYKNIAGTYTLIGITTTTSFNDYGYTGWPYLDWIPTTAPAAALADWLLTSIATNGGGGTTTLTLSATATTAASGQTVAHDDTAALSLIPASMASTLSGGTYNVTSQVNWPTNATVNASLEGTIFNVVTPGIIAFNLASGDTLDGATFRLPPGAYATYVNTGASTVRVRNLRCYGESTGGVSPSFALGVNNTSWVWADYISMTSLSGAVGFGTGGEPCHIYSFGTSGGGNANGLTITSPFYANNGSQMQSFPAIKLEDTYNSIVSKPILQGQSYALSNNQTGISVLGGGQGNIIKAGQILNFTYDIYFDAGSGGPCLAHTVSETVTDFAGVANISIQACTWVTLTGNTIVGEGIANAYGVVAGASMTDKLEINGGTINGFSGTGSYAVNLQGSPTNSKIIGVTFTNNNGKVFGSLGANSRIESNPGLNPIGVTGPTTVGASPQTICAGTSPETHYFLQSATNTASVKLTNVSGPLIGTMSSATIPVVVHLGPQECEYVTWTTTAPTYTKSVH